MGGIVVAGNVGIDRIWQLDRPLRTGARLQCGSRVLRLGGGAANTAAALGELGHTPVIAASIAADAAGDDMVAAIRAAGLDTSGIQRPPGQTSPGDIFLDPEGERTLIGGMRKPRPLPPAVFAHEWTLLYVNIACLGDPAALAGFRDRPWVVAQLPADLQEMRPAHVLIASRSDIGDLPADLLWRQRRALDGDMLRGIVITDGGRGADIVDRQGIRHCPTTSHRIADSIGAGDFFAAGMIAALVERASIVDAVRQGQAAASRFILSRPAMLRVLGPG
jgi:sugar/nucleoside kinase (ribokinase family)